MSCLLLISMKIFPSALGSAMFGLFNGVRRIVRLLVIVFVVVASSRSASVNGGTPPSRSVDVLSFTPPAGWQTTQKAGSGPVTMSDANPADGIWCSITVYNSLQSSGDLAADFLSEWTAIIGSVLPEKRNVLNEGARMDGTAPAVPISGETNYARLVTYRAGTAAAPTR